LLKSRVRKQSSKFGRHLIPPKKQLLIVIRTMATKIHIDKNKYTHKLLNYKFILKVFNKWILIFRYVSDRFDVGKVTTYSVQRVVNALYANVTKFFRWPTREGIEETIKTIQRNHTFSEIIGVIDDTYKNCTKRLQWFLC